MPAQLLQADASPVDVARALELGDATGLIFFDSGRAAAGHDAQWSVIACEPTAVLSEVDADFVELIEGRAVDNPVDWLQERARSVSGESDGPLPFYGGLAGMLGFEFAWRLDEIRAEAKPSRTPQVWVGDYPTAIVYSHVDERWWLTGEPDSAAAARLLDALEDPQPRPAAAGEGANFRLTIDPHEYVARAQRAVDAIYAGDLFEINYTERFAADWQGSGFSLYEALRQTSSGAYCAYFDAGDYQLASVSPEQFIAVDDGRVATRPIKGTRRRSPDPAEDARLGEELVTSEKDRAENVMIVDLMRNDLTQICRLGSVEATELCGLHSFSGVHHLVSTVEGELAAGFGAMDALMACFPAGSITGAPKLRSIELIAELEETARGPYCGSLFYASSHGRLDSSVLIRTAVLADGVVEYGAGGAIVADSDPRGEYEEALVKASPLEQVIDDA